MSSHKARDRLDRRMYPWSCFGGSRGITNCGSEEGKWTVRTVFSVAGRN
jgi:hypothetical protein